MRRKGFTPTTRHSTFSGAGAGAGSGGGGAYRPETFTFQPQLESNFLRHLTGISASQNTQNNFVRACLVLASINQKIKDGAKLPTGLAESKTLALTRACVLHLGTEGQKSEAFRFNGSLTDIAALGQQFEGVIRSRTSCFALFRGSKTKKLYSQILNPQYH